MKFVQKTDIAKIPILMRPRRTVTVVCTCGMRYIKTRPKQMTCIKCFVRAEDLKKIKTR